MYVYIQDGGMCGDVASKQGEQLQVQNSPRNLTLASARTRNSEARTPIYAGTHYFRIHIHVYTQTHICACGYVYTYVPAHIRTRQYGRTHMHVHASYGSTSVALSTCAAIRRIVFWARDYTLVVSDYQQHNAQYGQLHAHVLCCDTNK